MDSEVLRVLLIEFFRVVGLEENAAHTGDSRLHQLSSLPPPKVFTVGHFSQFENFFLRGLG